MWPPAEWQELHQDWTSAWLLHCSLYGLKEAMVDWDDFFAEVATGQHNDDSFEKHLHMRRLESDASAFYDPGADVVLSKHVDDLLIVGPARAVRYVLDALKVHLLLKETPPLELEQKVQHLGRIIKRKPYGFTLRSRDELFDSLFETAGLLGANPTSLPGTKADAYNDEEEGVPLNDGEYSLYRKLVGKLLFIAMERGDIQYAVKQCSRRLAGATDKDLGRCRRVIRYLLGTRYAVQKIEPTETLEETRVMVKVDADWASDQSTRRSTSGGAKRMAGALVLCWSRTQTTVATSSAEAELNAIGSGAVEGLGTQSLLSELNMTAPLIVASDSSAGISIASRLGLAKVKHVEIRRLFMQDLVCLLYTSPSPRDS